MNAGIDPDLSYSARIESELRTLGYVIYSRTLNASDFGVPQRRSRYFIIGLEEGLAKTSADPFDVLWGERTDFLKTKGLAAAERTSVRDAISDLETTGAVLRSSVDTPGYLQIEYSGPRTRYQKLMRDGLGTVAPDSLRLVKHREGTIEKLAYIIARCEPGRKVPKAVRAELGLSKHTLNLLCPTQPAATLTCLPDDMIHYNEPRILTVREYARLQSFPDSFAVLGRYTTGGQRRRTQSPRYTQIGNAVPPLLAEALGRALLVITNGRAA
jgi:DNA (cytosine-5)-methyltransferase 1